MSQEKRVEAFWAKVEVDGQDPKCWLWTAAKLLDGYGHFWDGTTMVGAHRFSYELENGPIAEDLEVDHLCENESCVRPSHLQTLTKEEHAKLSFERDPGKNVGERHGRVKLTDADVADIFFLSSIGITQRAIGDVFGITQAYVCRILKGDYRSRPTHPKEILDHQLKGT